VGVSLLLLSLWKVLLVLPVSALLVVGLVLCCVVRVLVWEVGGGCVDVVRLGRWDEEDRGIVVCVSFLSIVQRRDDVWSLGCDDGLMEKSWKGRRERLGVGVGVWKGGEWIVNREGEESSESILLRVGMICYGILWEMFCYWGDRMERGMVKKENGERGDLSGV
jgi:hypothetical protein